jgi:hypothetical protein
MVTMLVSRALSAFPVIAGHRRRISPFLTLDQAGETHLWAFCSILPGRDECPCCLFPALTRNHAGGSANPYEKLSAITARRREGPRSKSNSSQADSPSPAQADSSAMSGLRCSVTAERPRPGTPDWPRCSKRQATLTRRPVAENRGSGIGMMSCRRRLKIRPTLTYLS